MYFGLLTLVKKVDECNLRDVILCNQWVCWIYGVVLLWNNAVFDRFMCLSWEPTALLIILVELYTTLYSSSCFATIRQTVLCVPSGLVFSIIHTVKRCVLTCFWMLQNCIYSFILVYVQQIDLYKSEAITENNFGYCYGWRTDPRSKNKTWKYVSVFFLLYLKNDQSYAYFTRYGEQWTLKKKYDSTDLQREPSFLKKSIITYCSR